MIGAASVRSSAIIVNASSVTLHVVYPFSSSHIVGAGKNTDCEYGLLGK
jgi:hypothetical protein